MAYTEFDPAIEQVKEEGINLAKQRVPDIAGAHEALAAAQNMLREHDESVVWDLHMGRLMCDDAVVDIRSGLYRRNYEGLPDREAAVIVGNAGDNVQEAYLYARPYVQPGGLLPDETYLLPLAKANVGATQKVWFQSIQTRQVLQGQLTKEVRADQAIVGAQWMLGRGHKREPGAYPHTKEGNNKYWSTQTCLLAPVPRWRTVAWSTG